MLKRMPEEYLANAFRDSLYSVALSFAINIGEGIIAPLFKNIALASMLSKSPLLSLLALVGPDIFSGSLPVNRSSPKSSMGSSGAESDGANPPDALRETPKQPRPESDLVILSFIPPTTFVFPSFEFFHRYKDLHLALFLLDLLELYQFHHRSCYFFFVDSLDIPSLIGIELSSIFNPVSGYQSEAHLRPLH